MKNWDLGGVCYSLDSSWLAGEMKQKDSPLRVGCDLTRQVRQFFSGHLRDCIASFLLQLIIIWFLWLLGRPLAKMSLMPSYQLKSNVSLGAGNEFNSIWSLGQIIQLILNLSGINVTVREGGRQHFQLNVVANRNKMPSRETAQ